MGFFLPHSTSESMPLLTPERSDRAERVIPGTGVWRRSGDLLPGAALPNQPGSREFSIENWNFDKRTAVYYSEHRPNDARTGAFMGRRVHYGEGRTLWMLGQHRTARWRRSGRCSGCHVGGVHRRRDSSVRPSAGPDGDSSLRRQVARRTSGIPGHRDHEFPLLSDEPTLGTRTSRLPPTGGPSAMSVRPPFSRSPVQRRDHARRSATEAHARAGDHEISGQRVPDDGMPNAEEHARRR